MNKRETKKASRIAAALACAMLCVLLLPLKCGAIVENVSAAYVYNVENELCVSAFNEHARLPVGATARMMTGLLACELLSDKLSDTITIEPHMLVSGESRLGIREGETMPLSDLVRGLVCSGYDDCAAALAVYLSGSIDGFVRLMNEKAVQLGMSSTVYEYPYAASSDKAGTTASDTARLALAASRNALFLEISDSFKYKLDATNLSGEVTIYNCNSLISPRSAPQYVNSSCTGLFSGYEKKAGYSLATLASRDELSYICVILGGEERDGVIYSYTTATELLDAAFENYSYATIVSKDTPICSVPVTMTDALDEIQAFPKEELVALVSKDELSQAVVSYRLLSASLEAPVEKGEKIGYLTVRVGTRSFTLELVAGQGAERSQFLHIMKSIEDFSTSRIFTAAVCCAVVLTVVAVYVDFRLRTGGERRRRRRRLR